MPGNTKKLMIFAFETTPRISLSCMLDPVHTENMKIVYWGLKHIPLVIHHFVIAWPVLTSIVLCISNILVSSWHVSSPHPDNFVVCEGNCRWVDFLKEILHCENTVAALARSLAITQHPTPSILHTAWNIQERCDTWAFLFFTVPLFARLKTDKTVRSVHLQFWKAPFSRFVSIRVVYM